MWLKMKKVIKKFKSCRLKIFYKGLLFASISVIALLLCLHSISSNNSTQTDVLLPFLLAILSLFMGFAAMFHDNIANDRGI